MSGYEFYIVDKKPPVAWVFLNRPDKNNAMGLKAWIEPIEIFSDLDCDPEIRVVIIAGKGSCFCSGIDLKEIVQMLPELKEKDQTGATKWSFLAKILRVQEGLTALEKCRKPVIAAIHGHCVGGGLDMATACDIRICSEDATFSLKEAAVGFVADVGVLQRIPLIIGQGHARELAFSARTIPASRAKEIQLVNSVHGDQKNLMEKAQELAMEIADNSPLAVQASKDVLNYCVGKSIEDGLKYVASVSVNIIPSRDLEEAVSAFAEKRKPNFSGK